VRNADDIFTRNTLDYRVEPNQQYRVDILKPTAAPFTVNPDAILSTLYRTKVGDPNRLAPTLLTFNLTRFAGMTVRLRFAEVDNQTFFQGSVDDVLTWTDRIEAVTAADVKQAAEYVLRIERSVTGLLLPEELARQAETVDTETVDTITDPAQH
jgi:hypothetical protein